MRDLVYWTGAAFAFLSLICFLSAAIGSWPFQDKETLR